MGEGGSVCTGTDITAALPGTSCPPGTALGVPESHHYLRGRKEKQRLREAR